MRTFILVALATAMLSLTGCVSVTAESRPEQSAFLDSESVGSDHALFHAVKVADTEGFVGTNPFLIAGRLSPNLNNDSAREAVEETLDKAGMLATDRTATYSLAVSMVKDGAIGAWGGGTSLNGIERDIVMAYVLRNAQTNDVIYNRQIESHGESDGGGMVFYLVEREAAEDATRNNLQQLIEDLLTLQPADLQ